MNGQVKWFDSKRGYGFIKGEDGQDYFCHWKSIEPKLDQNGKRLFASLTENAKVRFEVEEKDGRKKAINVVEIQEKGTEEGSEIGAKTEEKVEEKVM